MKEWRLLARDLWFFARGGADVHAANWREDPWLYPADWSYQLDREPDYFLPKDRNGIPVRVFRPPLGAQYLPSRIAAYGLANWNRWRRCRDDRSAGEFRLVADWFARRHIDGRYVHDFPIAGLDAGWISCIAQGEALSILARALHATGDRSYLGAARQVSRWLIRPEAEGGLRSRLPDGSPFVEEYPGTQYRHVLNGCLYAAVGLHDYLRCEPEDAAEVDEFFRALIDGIASNLGRWDVHGWSAYDFADANRSDRNLNTMTYQLLQVVLLEYLADRTGDVRLADMSRRWSHSATRFRSRCMALGGKLAYRVKAGW